MAPAKRERLLSVRYLSVSFGIKTVIRDLAFDVTRGENLAIIGPNGSGKTVLLRALLNGLPYQGEIRWTTGTRLGYLPQMIAADRQLPLLVSELLGAKARLLKLSPEAVTHTTHIVGLTQELLATRVGVLSGGQFQKVLIAFALLGEPNAILVDEPTASLDELAQEHVYELLERLRREVDVMSHVALSGLGLAFLFHFNPLLGGGATLFLGTLLIWQLQKKTGFATEAMIGVVFAASLAIGAALTPQEDLVEALFGKFQPLSPCMFSQARSRSV